MSNSDPGAVIVTLVRRVTMDFRWIPSGDFLMGSRGVSESEEPRHRVAISRGFYLGATPVTRSQFGAWARDHTPPDGRHDDEFKDRPDNPAEHVSWNDARAFCAWLNETRPAGFPRSYVATLPTEAEWEYACRAGTESEYYTGDGEAALGLAGWFGSNSGKEPHPVRMKDSNKFELFDMHGNVYEWCCDVWDADAYKVRVDGIVDPGSDDRAPILGETSVSKQEGPGRVIRGGPWFSATGTCRSACRHWDGPDVRWGGRGFRVCLVSGPQSGEGLGAPGDGARPEAGAESEGAERGRGRRSGTRAGKRR